jgi:hypothetical protein
LRCPLPLAAGAVLALSATAHGDAPARWWAPGDGRIFPEHVDYPNGHGVLRTLLVGGPMETKGHPFFRPTGPGGRACVTCHQPADGMSLSAATAARRWDDTGGKDPLFAAYDGSDCPTLPQAERASHSLLLEHGLIRIERPWPPRRSGRVLEPDFTIAVVRDPNGCNSGPHYGPRAGTLSVYRRPRPVANVKYLEAAGFAYDPKQGVALPRDPETGRYLSGNLMADGRVGTLGEQMQDASRTHLQLFAAMSAADRARIIDFERRVFTAQQIGAAAGALDSGSATGGPAALAAAPAGRLGSIGKAVWSDFAAWDTIGPEARKRLTPEQIAARESIARGARIFRDKTFLISDSAGINSPIGFGNPVRNSCVFCHNMTGTGMDVAPGQVDLGSQNLPFADPQPWLPTFKITCLGKPHPHYGPVIYTHDPGFALTTGRCADVGKITIQQMRGLAARAPYFSNGSAKDLRGIVDYYDRRYGIGYTEQEKRDLTNLLGAL